MMNHKKMSQEKTRNGEESFKIFNLGRFFVLDSHFGWKSSGGDSIKPGLTLIWCSEEDEDNEEEEAVPEDEESDVEDPALQVGGRRQRKSSLLFSEGRDCLRFF